MGKKKSPVRWKKETGNKIKLTPPTSPDKSKLDHYDTGQYIACKDCALNDKTLIIISTDPIHLHMWYQNKKLATCPRCGFKAAMYDYRHEKMWLLLHNKSIRKYVEDLPIGRFPKDNDMNIYLDWNPG